MGRFEIHLIDREGRAVEAAGTDQPAIGSGVTPQFEAAGSLEAPQFEVTGTGGVDAETANSDASKSEPPVGRARLSPLS
jgi:hypothetical protein